MNKEEIAALILVAMLFAYMVWKHQKDLSAATISLQNPAHVPQYVKDLIGG